MIANPSIISKRFAPFGRSRLLSQPEILERIVVNPESCPEILLLVGPSRSGTSAFCQLFSQLVSAYYQPVKSILRNGGPNFSLDEGGKIFIKETIGPWRTEECEFDPLALLLAAGVPREKIRLAVILRDPVDTFSSWKDSFENTSLDKFFLAYLNCFFLHSRSLRDGIVSTKFVFEELLWNRVGSVQKLFEFFELPFHRDLMEWPSGTFNYENIRLTQEASVESFREVFLDKTAQRKGLYFEGRDTANLTILERRKIERTLEPYYEDFSKHVRGDLPVSIVG